MPHAAEVPHALWSEHVTKRATTRSAKHAATSQELTARQRSALRTQLWEAIKANDADAVKLALDEGADPTQHKVGDAMKTLPLIAAIHQDNIKIIDHLLNAGVRIHLKSSYHNSIVKSVLASDNPIIAERLLSMGMPMLSDPAEHSKRWDSSDYPEKGLTNLLIESYGYESPRLKTWWLKQGGQGLPNQYWPDLPLSPPSLDGEWSESHKVPLRDSRWAQWLHGAAQHQDADFAQAVREHILGWTALEAAGHDPRLAWRPMLEGPWNDAVLGDHVARLEWLVGQRWTPASLCDERGIAWSWLALTSNATNAYAWLIEVPGMAEQMRLDVVKHPRLTLHRPVEKANHADKSYVPFLGWTLPMLNRLMRAGVDVGMPDDQGNHLFHRTIFTHEGDVTRKEHPSFVSAPHETLMTWLGRYRPDLISVPNHEGLDVLALGDSLYGTQDYWRVPRARLESAVLRGVAETVEEDLAPSRPRSRL